MHSSEFETKLAKARELIASCDPVFGSHFEEREPRQADLPLTLNGPMERGLLLLAELYLEASAPKREQLREGLGNLALSDFMARVLELIRSPRDARWVRIFLAAAGLDGGRSDYRDLIAALSGLIHAVSHAQIDIEPFFVEAREMSPGIAEWLRPAYLATVMEH